MAEENYMVQLEKLLVQHRELAGENEHLQGKIREIREYALAIVQCCDRLRRPKAAIFQQSVGALQTSARIYNVLMNADVRTIAQLVVKTEDEFLRMKKFGRKSLDEIKEILAHMGLRLGMTEEEMLIWEAPNSQVV